MRSRRDFVKTTAAGTASLAAAADGIPRRPLGRTGLEVSIFGLGGAPTGLLADGQKALEVIRRCYDLGVNYFDASASASYGLSQVRYGLAFKGLRDKIVLATKTRQRTFTQAEVDLNLSLRQLQTDRIDLYQIHNLTSDEDLDFLFGPRGAMELIEKAKQAGKIRFVGITCHGDPALLNRALERYPFDTVLMTLNLADGANQQKSFEKTTLPVALKKGLGVIAMKTLAGGNLLRRKAATAKECLSYVWSLPVSAAVPGCQDIEQVETDAAVARAAKPLSKTAMEALRRRVASLEFAALEPWKGLPAASGERTVYRAD